MFHQDYMHLHQVFGDLIAFFGSNHLSPGKFQSFIDNSCNWITTVFSSCELIGAGQDASFFFLDTSVE